MGCPSIDLLLNNAITASVHLPALSPLPASLDQIGDQQFVNLQQSWGALSLSHSVRFSLFCVLGEIDGATAGRIRVRFLQSVLDLGDLGL